MAPDRSKDCVLKDRNYPHGSELGHSGSLIRCNDGKWESVVLVSGI